MTFAYNCDQYHAFWSAYLDRYPHAAERGLKSWRKSNQWLPTARPATLLGLFLSKGDCGIYVRGEPRADFDNFVKGLHRDRHDLGQRLHVPFTPRRDLDWVFFQERPLSYLDPMNWPAMIDYLDEMTVLYLDTFTDLFGNAA